LKIIIKLTQIDFDNIEKVINMCISYCYVQTLAMEGGQVSQFELTKADNHKFFSSYFLRLHFIAYKKKCYV